jgi:hypothetical protein
VTLIKAVNLPISSIQTGSGELAVELARERVRVNRLNDYVTKPLYQELFFGAQSFDIAGTTGAPGREAGTGLLLFDAAATENIYLSVLLPRAWEEGTGVQVHIHWTKTTSAAGNVTWTLTHETVDIGNTYTGGTAISTAAVSYGVDTNTAYQYLMSSLPDIDLGSYHLGAMMLLTVTRLGGNVADTYGADARLLGVSVVFRRDYDGSVEAFDK